MGNELKLSLENFQSISKGELIFHTGTNVIIGQSNSGKSATFRALKTCLSNPSGSQRFIKKGTSHSSVMLEYNGNQIIWKRTPKENSYIVNGETYLKTGKSNAFKIVEDTGFAVDSNDTIMNIEEELQLPFPFGMSDSDLFKLYENVFCISDSAIILKAAKGVEDSTKTEIATIENDIIKNENKLKELLAFKETIDLEKLKKMKKYLESKNNKVLTLKDGLPIIKRALKVEGIHAEEKVFKSLLPEYKDVRYLRRLISQLKALHAFNNQLKEIVQPKEVPLDKYEDLRQLSNTVRVLNSIEGLSVPVKEFKSQIEAYNSLKNYLESLKSIQKYIKLKKERLEEVESRLKDIEDKLKEFKVCPLCHRPL